MCSMGLKKYLYYYDYIFIVISSILFVFGTSNLYENYTLPLSIASIFILLGCWLIRGIKINLPKNYILYLVFLVFLSIHTAIYGGKIVYIFLFLSGGLYWITVYNLRVTISKYFFNFLILLGIIMAGITAGSLALGLTYSNANSLFLPAEKGSLHNHLGDLWAIIITGVIYKAIQKFHIWQIPLIALGVIIIAFSLSRSAILALVVGTMYTYWQSTTKKMPKWILITTIGIASIIFIFSSSFKTTLFSRPYVGESIGSLIKYPFGIGIGNFVKASHESTSAHNVLLEIVSGMGIYSIIFIIWSIKVLRSLVTSKNNVMYMALLLAISVNFLFDTTYIIPTMLWTWFSVLGLSCT